MLYIWNFHVFLYLHNHSFIILLADQTLSPTRIQNKKRDFYRDPDVEEIKSCYHILEELKLRVNELLKEWPDQPTLKTVI